jgi:hypothetical protein
MTWSVLLAAPEQKCGIRGKSSLAAAESDIDIQFVLAKMNPGQKRD